MVTFGAGFTHPSKKRMATTATYVQHFGGRWVGCGKRAAPKATSKPPSPRAFLLWGATHAVQNRQYEALIMKWWSAGAPPNGHAWWAALASAHPVICYDGITRTLDAPRFFLSWQRRTLATDGWLASTFTPQPRYEFPPLSGIMYDYPDYPRGTWSPPAPPSIAYISAHDSTKITMWWTNPPCYPNDYYAVFVSLRPKNPTPSAWPHYFVMPRDPPDPPAPFPLQGNNIELQGILPPAHQGQPCRTGIALLDASTRQSSEIHWTNLYFS